MRTGRPRWISVAATVLALGTASRLTPQEHKSEHPRFVVRDIGTFGGPDSFYFSEPVGEIAGNEVAPSCKGHTPSQGEAWLCGHAYVLIPCDGDDADTEDCRDGGEVTAAISQSSPGYQPGPGGRHSGESGSHGNDGADTYAAAPPVSSTRPRNWRAH
jgi:hypothetical protein